MQLELRKSSYNCNVAQIESERVEYGIVKSEL